MKKWIKQYWKKWMGNKRIRRKEWKMNEKILEKWMENKRIRKKEWKMNEKYWKKVCEIKE